MSDPGDEMFDHEGYPQAEPYLVAHVVRGEPAFDIAIRLQIGDEEGWIIPTSGHRAYPYWACQLIIDNEPIQDNPITPRHPWIRMQDDLAVPPAPDGWPDHYQTHAAKGTGLITNLAERLGLIPKGRINRR